MNQQQRKKMHQVLAQLDHLKTEIESEQATEQQKFDDMPENLQGSDRGQAIESAADALQSAVDSIGEVIGYINEAIGE